METGDKKTTFKERAKEMRKAAYQKAKERNKAYKLEQASSPAAIERKLRLKEKRRQDYLKAKEAHKARTDEKKERAKQELAEAEALRDAEILAALVPGDQVRPALRVIRGGRADGPSDSELT